MLYNVVRAWSMTLRYVYISYRMETPGGRRAMREMVRSMVTTSIQFTNIALYYFFVLLPKRVFAYFNILF